MRVISVAVAAVLGLSGSTPAIAVTVAPTPPEDTCVLEHGVYVGVGERTRHAHPTSVTGTIFWVDEVRFVEHTRSIAMQLGKEFGIRYRIANLPRRDAVRVTWRIWYPRPIRGRAAFEHSFEEVVPDGVLLQHLGYELEYAWEMVPGRWRFEVLIDDRRRCTFAFDVR